MYLWSPVGASCVPVPLDGVYLLSEWTMGGACVPLDGVYLLSEWTMGGACVLLLLGFPFVSNHLRNINKRGLSLSLTRSFTLTHAHALSIYLLICQFIYLNITMSYFHSHILTVVYWE